MNQALVRDNTSGVINGEGGVAPLKSLPPSCPTWPVEQIKASGVFREHLVFRGFIGSFLFNLW